ncbi:MAG: pyrroline-5-carboxylate reductase [Cyanobacteriota bacterium]|nr:pyrroline-5-carboxylate reductase [Cyanobacteriota bacterium]
MSLEPPGLGVVGLGRMAQALLEPWISDQLIAPEAVRAVVGSEASRDRWANATLAGHALRVSTDPREAWQAPLVLLAVKPQQLEAVATTASLADIPGDPSSGEAPSSPRLLLSVLAGVRLDRLRGLFPSRTCVRAVVNTPALVRHGLTALAWADSPSPEVRQRVEGLFRRVGEVWTLPESQLDAFLALTASGPAFVALVAEALADGAVAAGLPRALAQPLALRTLGGTVALLEQKDLHPGQLKDMVSSPGGTTMAGLRELERAGLRSALLEAVLAAAERSQALA